MDKHSTAKDPFVINLSIFFTELIGKFNMQSDRLFVCGHFDTFVGFFQAMASSGQASPKEGSCSVFF